MAEADGAAAKQSLELHVAALIEEVGALRSFTAAHFEYMSKYQQSIRLASGNCIKLLLQKDHTGQPLARSLPKGVLSLLTAIAKLPPPPDPSNFLDGLPPVENASPAAPEGAETPSAAAANPAAGVPVGVAGPPPGKPAAAPAGETTTASASGAIGSSAAVLTTTVPASSPHTAPAAVAAAVPAVAAVATTAPAAIQPAVAVTAPTPSAGGTKRPRTEDAPAMSHPNLAPVALSASAVLPTLLPPAPTAPVPTYATAPGVSLAPPAVAATTSTATLPTMPPRPKMARTEPGVQLL